MHACMPHVPSGHVPIANKAPRPPSPKLACHIMVLALRQAGRVSGRGWGPQHGSGVVGAGLRVDVQGVASAALTGGRAFLLLIPSSFFLSSNAPGACPLSHMLSRLRAVRFGAARTPASACSHATGGAGWKGCTVQLDGCLEQGLLPALGMAIGSHQQGGSPVLHLHQCIYMYYVCVCRRAVCVCVCVCVCARKCSCRPWNWLVAAEPVSLASADPAASARAVCVRDGHLPWAGARCVGAPLCCLQIRGPYGGMPVLQRVAAQRAAWAGRCLCRQRAAPHVRGVMRCTYICNTGARAPAASVVPSCLG